MLVCTEGNTNRECSFFWGGVVGYRGYRGDRSYRGGSTAWIGGMEDFGAGEDFFCGIAKFYLFLEIEVGNGFIHIGVLPLVGTAAVWLSAHYQRLIV